ncbi:TerB family tellurite resistance protein [Mucilaginibacter ginsenosidivorans]|uniref:TerB family tellurite resistance protein n=1 Tax=Mucilaginibacter ginsenosidivorans TaxID=398053 RepID=A0A5B8V479_9SPHI|nr:TerB family tellurite resistance protein [Mucilaginibacter ginsenosidivorans]
MLLLTATATKSRAQTTDMVQLILDIEKLTQLKCILSDMKTGYDLINGGYNQVKSIAQGNFNLHQTFLNGLLAVSPAVAKYGRVADIVLEQGYIVAEYTRTFSQAKQSGRFSADEIAYLGNVYTTLLQQSLLNLSRLADILTTGKLRMSDDERLRAIDHIYADTDDKLTFLRHFDQQATILAVQRKNEQNEIRGIQNLY